MHVAARDGLTPFRRPGGAGAAAAALALTFFAGPLVGVGRPLAGQGVELPPVRAMHPASLARRVEAEVHGALLAPDDEVRDAHVEAAVQLARLLAASDSLSAEAQYWLAVALGVKTEFSGPLQKLTTGREVFFVTARVLELDPDHPGGHEMMGRLHAAVMRLPWLVRSLALRMGMGEVLGDASWDEAERHFRLSRDGDPSAIAPRLELAKLLLQRERAVEARPVLEEISAIAPAHEVDRRMRTEGLELLAGLGPEGRPEGSRR